jgi:hypothetical protein
MRKHFAVVAILLLPLVLSPLAKSAGTDEVGDAYQPHRVVMPLNSSDEKVQRAALNNIKNLSQEFGPQTLPVGLVIHGTALPLLLKKGTALSAELSDLKQSYGAVDGPADGAAGAGVG